MIKYILILHLCTYFGQVNCTSQRLLPYEYKSYHECITQGYIHSYHAIMEMDKEKVEKEKIAVRFACRQIAPPEVGA